MSNYSGAKIGLLLVSVGAALLLLAFFMPEATRQLTILVINQNKQPIPAASLEIRKFTIVPLLQIRIRDVVTDSRGQATFAFSNSKDYSIYLTGKPCAWISGNHPFSASEIATGGPLVVQTRAISCEGQ